MTHTKLKRPVSRRSLLTGGLGLHCSLLLAGLPATVLAQAAPSRVLVVGDSLSAEYGLPRGTGWVALLAQRLKDENVPTEVINASISGDTTAGGRSRLPKLLSTHKPSVVVIELGGNDALRGLPLPSTRDNLRAMTRAARASGAKVVLVGMQVPPNYGRSYTQQFAGMYAALAQAESSALVPFLLKGVADLPDARSQFQADRIHPLAAAHPQILANVWPALRPLLPGH